MIQLDKLCALSQLDLTAANAADRAQLTQQLESMIALADQVRGAAIEGLTPLFHPLELTQPLREDRASSTEGYRAGLLHNAPKHDQAFFLVPKILD